MVLTQQEQEILRNELTLDELKTNKALKHLRGQISKILEVLREKGAIEVVEVRYEFRNSKISTGLFGINRIYLPSSRAFSTLVASDTNDYIALKDFVVTEKEGNKEDFLNEIYFKGNYRKINKKEASSMQGFPLDFKLPEKRNRWMKLLGNSISVPVVEAIFESIKKTKVLKVEKM